MPDDPPRLTTQFGQSLAKLGLVDKALRVEQSGRKSAQRDGNNDKWWVYVPWDSHLRTSRGYAERQSREQVKLYSPLRQLVGESFGVLTFRFCLSLDPTTGREKMKLFVLRGIIRKVIPNGIYKIGALQNDTAFKVICIEPLTSDQVSLIQDALPRTVKLEWANRPAADFDSCLRRLLAADLPSNDTDRARLEYVLDHIRQIAVFGTAYEVISKSNKSIEKSPRNPLKIKDRPRNPKTDAIATAYVPPKAQEVPFEDIDPCAWRQYQDYVEIDATTPADHAQMLESHAPDPPQDNSRENQAANPYRGAQVRPGAS